ncbi:ergothioneine biosynthesis protein EgtB [Allohahella marinimesophila]|uniref:Ergothioneine biosynthesis protein EgtB n=1 Tax=Allohahella marinimesophila TaxID=1054972 RepID=A0ABP7P2P8_9GAMM
MFDRQVSASATVSDQRTEHISGHTERFRKVRKATLGLVKDLSSEDMSLQSMEDASPSKWHLAHTTWFFEELILKPFASNYSCFNDHFNYLFNSYYEAIGDRHPRPLRGMLSRPSSDDVIDYRHHVDAAMTQLLSGIDSADSAETSQQVLARTELGCHHEMQHQELLLTDQLHAFSQHPLLPRWAPELPLSKPHSGTTASAMRWVGHAGGILSFGADTANESATPARAKGFAYDCEGPRHQRLLEPFKIASRPVTNQEWLEFMADDGYRNPEFWLSDGWAAVKSADWNAPLHWRQDGNRWLRFTPHGVRELDPLEHVCHISYFEADAFARWAGARLPDEFEWEAVAADQPLEGRFQESGIWLPERSEHDAGSGIESLFGSVWEWTRSAFAAYPRFRPLDGALAEYNGKFMCGQFVLRGGAFTSPIDLIRPTYRNFFYPHQRWQATGLRLAKDD